MTKQECIQHIFLGQYKAGGRGELCPVRHIPLYNCWGLCISLGKVFGHDIPEITYPAAPTARAVNNLYEHFQNCFTRLDKPTAGCLVAFRTHPRLLRAVNHFGIMLDQRNFCHILKESAVHVLPIAYAPYCYFFAGYYWVK